MGCVDALSPGMKMEKLELDIFNEKKKVGFV